MDFTGEREKEGTKFATASWAPLWIAMDASPLELDPAGRKGQGSFDQGSDVLRARCQEGKCTNSLSGTVSFKQTHFKILLERGQEETNQEASKVVKQAWPAQA
jgi:hypothetical protein